MNFKERAQREIRKITDTIVQKYKPEKIILFGSFAYGNPKPSSDIDMLIVKRTSKRRIDRIKELLFMVDNEMPFEPLVYTPDEIKERVLLNDFFIGDILKKGKLLYAKQ